MALLQHFINGSSIRKMDTICFDRFLHSLPLRVRSGLKATFGRNDGLVVGIVKRGAMVCRVLLPQE